MTGLRLLASCSGGECEVTEADMHQAPGPLNEALGFLCRCFDDGGEHAATYGWTSFVDIGRATLTAHKLRSLGLQNIQQPDSR